MPPSTRCSGPAELAPAVAALSAAYRSGAAAGGGARRPDRPPGRTRPSGCRRRSPRSGRRCSAGPGLRPATLLDLGGGTGAAIWAAAATLPSLLSAQVLDGSATGARAGPRRSPRTHRTRCWPARPGRGPGGRPSCRPPTWSRWRTSLGELPAEEQVAVVAAAAGRAGASRSSRRARRPASGTCSGPGRPCSAPGCGSSRPARTTRPARGRPARTGATSRPAAPLGPAPAGQGRPARLGGREVLLRRRGPGRRPTGRRAGSCATRSSARGWSSSPSARPGPGSSG